MALADGDGYSGSGGGTYGGLMTGISTIVWGPHKGSGGAYGLQHGEGYDVLVYSNTNKYDAALLALGYDMDWINANTTDLAVRGKLSSSEYGGVYYTIVNNNTFKNPSQMQDTYTDPTLVWGDGMYGSAVGANKAIFGANYIYYVRFTEAQRLSARNTISEIIAGGGTSGGGSGGEVTVPETITSVASATYGNPSASSVQLQPTRSTLSGNARYITDVLGGYNVAYPYTAVFWLYAIRSGTWGVALVVLKCKSLPNNVSSAENISNGSIDLRVAGTGGYRAYFWRYSDLTYEYVNDSSIGKSVGLTITEGKRSAYDSTMSDNDVFRLGQSAPNVPFGIGQVYSVAYNLNGLSSTPVIPDPPPDWPEPDPDPQPEPQPDPPDVPDVDIDVPITGPTYQVITNNTSYVTNNNTTAPNVTIDLQGVIDAMNEHCIHLQTAINGAAQQLNDNLGASIVRAGNGVISAIDDGCGYVVDTIENEFLSLRRYLKELFEWLSERLDFDVDIENNVDPFDDTSIIAWLKRIWVKLGNSPMTKPPIDTDPKGFWDWLTAQLQKMIDELLGLGGAALSGPTGILEELLGKFPFSVPWDVAALLALLVAEPVAPVFDLPLPTAGAVSETHQLALHIDLTWLEPAVTATKFVELVAWAMWLLSQVPKWLNDIKVDDVLG